MDQIKRLFGMGAADIHGQHRSRTEEIIMGARIAQVIKANREITWKCLRCGQTWRSRIADRTDGHGCPVCSGERLVKGINDFATEHPELAAEWSGKNDKDPSEVRSKSRENVWWRCGSCGPSCRVPRVR